MALVLSRRTGESFAVGGRSFTMGEILSDREFMVRRDGDGKMFRIQDGRSIEVLPEVRLSVGHRGQLDMARVSIEAPRSMKITRGE